MLCCLRALAPLQRRRYHWADGEFQTRGCTSIYSHISLDRHVQVGTCRQVLYLSYEYLTLDRSKSLGWPLSMSGGQVPVRFATSYKQRHLLAVAPARSRDTYELTRVPPTESIDLEQTFEWYELVMFLCNVEPGLKDIARTFGSNLVPFQCLTSTCMCTSTYPTSH